MTRSEYITLGFSSVFIVQSYDSIGTVKSPIRKGSNGYVKISVRCSATFGLNLVRPIGSIYTGESRLGVGKSRGWVWGKFS